METNDRVIFRIRSRLWKDTIAGIDRDSFQISSTLVSLVTSLPYDVDPILLHHKTHQVTTTIHSTVDRSQPIPLWLIILAVAGGLLLLAALSLILWKVLGISNLILVIERAFSLLLNLIQFR